LIGAFKALKLENVELDVYSCFKIYGWEEQDKEWEPLYNACKETPNVNYHGTVSNDEIRSALQQTHILAYPNVYPETGCISAIEAMSAGCIVVCPNLGVLPETCANFAWMYGFVQDKTEHARKFAYVLKDAINNFWEPPVQAGLAFQKQYYDMHYDIETTAKQWTMMLETIKNNIENSCIISSFNPFVLRRVRKLNPNIQTAYLWTKNNPLFIINSPLLAWLCKPDGFHADIDFLEEQLMKWIRRKKMSVITFTVISQQQLSKALNLEVDGIIMDDPHLK